jgi:dynein heavy chain 1, cytosolic
LHPPPPPLPLPHSPSITLSQDFEAWVNDLPDKNSPTWLGLPASAEDQLQSLMGQRILSGLTSLMGVEDADMSISADSKGQKSGLETISAWILQLTEALNQIPSIDLSFSSDVSCSPLQRCLAREIFKGKLILSSVLDDISFVRSLSPYPRSPNLFLSLTSSVFVRSFYAGEIKSTNVIRELISCFLKGTVPQQWRGHFATTSRTTVGGWISNLSARCSFLQHYSTAVLKAEAGKASPKYWLGGLFSPEAFITATRQTTAQVSLIPSSTRSTTFSLSMSLSPTTGASRSSSCILRSERTERKARTRATSSRGWW